MEKGLSNHEIVANELVKDAGAAEKSKASKECGTLDSGRLTVTFRKQGGAISEDDEIIEEELSVPRNKCNSPKDSEILQDSLEEDNRSISESSDKSSTSSSSSSSSTSTSSASSHSSASSQSSFKKTKPTRLAQTFRKCDLVNELNKTRVINRSNSHERNDTPKVKRGSIKTKHSSPKVNSWIDPKSIKGTKNDEKKLKNWMAQKEKEKKKQLKESRKADREKREQELEDNNMKDQLQKKNFEQWESKKKGILEQKIKQSEELKARKREKELENIEKVKYSEKAFQSWKSRKEETTKEERKAQRMKEKEKHEEEEGLRQEKERNQKHGFEMWCQRQAELEEKKNDALRASKEAEAELELLEEYRRRDAEEEYIQWKREKSLTKSPPPKPVEHPLGWAPAGKSDGRHRTSPNIRSPSPGEPLSKTLANIKNGPTFHRRLKTVDVCCRQISFWCHCQSENGCPVAEGCHEESFQRSFSQPTRASTPRASPSFSKQQKYYNYEGGRGNGYDSQLQLSRHTTPDSSRPATPTHHPATPRH